MDTRRELGRGLLWIGSANLIAKLIDALSQPLTLALLDTGELGLATLAWTVTTFVETFNGLGVNAALVQADELSDAGKASAHSYAVLASLSFGAAVFLLAPAIAAAYHDAELTPLVRISSLKLVFVGLAHVPLALASRALRFERLGAITSLATLLSALLTLSLAALGFGAWAPVIGNTAHGLFQLLGACILVPYFPRPRWVWRELAPLARMGWHLTGASAASQVTRNLDYLVLGQLGGLAALGTYRIAFDLAMAPALAIQQAASRFALPVYARAARLPGELGPAIAWMARNTATLVFVPLLLAFFVGIDLFQVLGKVPEMQTESVVRLLSVAAFLRALCQIQGPALVATGHPRRALAEALLTTLTLAAALALSVTLLTSWVLELRLACAWVVAYTLIQPIELGLLRGLAPKIAQNLARTLAAPVALALAVGVAAWVLVRLSPLGPGAGRLLVHGSAILLLYAVGVRYGLGVRWTELRGTATRERGGESPHRDRS